MEHPIELMLGIILLLSGLSVIFRQDDWRKFAEFCQVQGNWTMLSLGGIDVILGSFIIAFHWVLTGIASLTTIVGLFLLLRGAIRVLFPFWVLGGGKAMRDHLWLPGLVSVIVSLPILYSWWLCCAETAERIVQ